MAKKEDAKLRNCDGVCEGNYAKEQRSSEAKRIEQPEYVVRDGKW
jgi:hypothetical protein